VYGALTPVVRQFREDVADVELVLVELKSAPEIELVNAGSLDAGFIHLPRSSLTGLRVLELDDEKKVVALPAEHALARHRQINPGQLAGKPFILFDRTLEPDTYDLVHDACRRHVSSPTSCR
jgi:DNA-binding transcriptional LysR family regulator